MGGIANNKEGEIFLTEDDGIGLIGLIDTGMSEDDRPTLLPAATPSYKEAAVSGEVLKDVKTMTPGTIDPADAKASEAYFARVYYEESGEAEKIEDCEQRLGRIAQAILNKELLPEKSIVKSIYAFSLPVDVEDTTVMKVYAFDRDDENKRYWLDEITGGLIELVKLKNGISSNLSVAERFNMIKALTEYLEGMIEQSEEEKLTPKMNLEIDYAKAVETLRKLSYEQGDMDNHLAIFGKNGMGNGFLDLVKKKFEMFLVNKRRYSENPIQLIAERVRLSVRPTSDELPSTKPRNESASERKGRIIDSKISRIKEIARTILEIIGRDKVDMLEAYVVTEEIIEARDVETGSDDFDTLVNKYVDLFELKNETDGQKMAQTVVLARLEIGRLALSKEVVASILGTFLANMEAGVPLDALMKISDMIE